MPEEGFGGQPAEFTQKKVLEVQPIEFTQKRVSESAYQDIPSKWVLVGIRGQLAVSLPGYTQQVGISGY